ncbi:RNA methyltransferase PUA domain-containing protein [Ornithinimicrobium sp. INDO-MA30-4]|uniref:RNA methyltransferase PUA domain-containing protein n=1 Tax=Ornithinimicrobium sp. INDO-MA30-4 TaxID=2908651 RepID=UPI002882ECAA|nr:RNA methyltransferase PUA domain-containing protein [Ornithinimicrobium sp. INDO-MA30-4]
MSAPLFLLDSGGLAEASVGVELVLRGSEGRHAADVSRLKTGEAVSLADGSGAIAHCAVSGTGKGELRAVIEELVHEPAPNPGFTLVQALAKGIVTCWPSRSAPNSASMLSCHGKQIAALCVGAAIEPPKA